MDKIDELNEKIDKLSEDNLEIRDNFNREIEIMYKLNHPNIVKLYGHFEDEKFCYFLMQYIPKNTLYDMVPQISKSQNYKFSKTTKNKINQTNINNYINNSAFYANNNNKKSKNTNLINTNNYIINTLNVSEKNFVIKIFIPS